MSISVNSVRISGSIGGYAKLLLTTHTDMYRETQTWLYVPVPRFECEDSIKLCLATGRGTLQAVPPQRIELLFSLVRSVSELSVVGDVERGPAIGVAQDVGDVGAHRELHPRVDLPGVLTAFVRVEQLVQTGSPVVILPLVTLSIISVEVGHLPLLEGENIGLVAPQVQ